MTDTDRTYGTRHTTGLPPRVADAWTGRPMVAAGLLTALAAFAPWVRIDKLDVTRTGLQEGPLLIGLGLVVAVCGALVAVRRGSAVVIAVAALASVVAFGLVLVGLGYADVDLSRHYRDLGIRDVAVQWGYYVELLFAAACVAAAVLVFARRATEKRL